VIVRVTRPHGRALGYHATPAVVVDGRTICATPAIQDTSLSWTMVHGDVMSSVSTDITLLTGRANVHHTEPANVVKVS